MYLLIVWLGVIGLRCILCTGSTSMCYTAACFLIALSMEENVRSYRPVHDSITHHWSRCWISSKVVTVVFHSLRNNLRLYSQSACRVCESVVLQFQPLTQLAGFYETCLTRYAIRSHCSRFLPDIAQ
jgi:hypothetical protein